MSNKEKKLVPEITPSSFEELDPVGHVPENFVLLHKETGQLISVSPNTYRRAFQDNNDYELKKSPVK